MEKKVLFSIVLIILLFNFSYSQDDIKSEKKAYKSEDGKLYYNLGSPLYFWISTSPTDNSDDVLLVSSTMPQYSNPMFLDMEGYNTLRTTTAADPKTKKQITTQTQTIFEIYADGLPPVSTSSFLIAEKYKSGTKQYYGKGLEIELKANDGTSGVENIYYSLNGASFQKYTKAVEIETEGEVKLRYLSLDNCGNEEKVHEYTFYVDKTPPVTIKQINGEQIGKVISQSATISLESTDNLTGVKATYYSIDGGKPVLYTTPLSAMLFFGGEHSLTYYAIDNVNNNNISNFGENTNTNFSFDFVVDKDGPTAELNITGDKYTGKQLFVSTRTKFEVVASDDFSKIEIIKYGINTEATTDYTTTLTLDGKQGFTTFKYFAQDEMGNIGKKYTTAVFVDAIEPHSYIDIGEPQFFHRDTLFISAEAKVKIISGDDESGLAKTEYSIDNAAYQTYTTEFKIDKAGFHKISFKATDNVNNVEVAKESAIYVDNLAPEIYVTFSIEPIREETKDGIQYPVYPTFSKLYLSATDKSTGEEEIYYSINGGTVTKYTSADLILKTGLLSKEQFYTVKVTAKDKLGNQNEKIINFFIAKK
jgi:hypothetical protein